MHRLASPDIDRKVFWPRCNRPWRQRDVGDPYREPVLYPATLGEVAFREVSQARRVTRDATRARARRTPASSWGFLAPAGEPLGHRPRAPSLPAPGRPSAPLRSFAGPPSPPAQLRLYPLHHALLPPLPAPDSTRGAHRRSIVMLPRSPPRETLSSSRPTLYWQQTRRPLEPGTA